MLPNSDSNEHGVAPHTASSAAAQPASAPPVDAAVRATTLELLKSGLLEDASKPNLYHAALVHREAVGRVLASLDLALRIDDIRGLAFGVVAPPADAADTDADAWSHPLVRRQRLTLEQSLLLAILRQQFVAHEVEAGIGAGDAGSHWMIWCRSCKPTLAISAATRRNANAC